MSQNKKTRIQERKQENNYINVPTYLFPESQEYSEDIISEQNNQNNNFNQSNDDKNNIENSVSGKKNCK